MILRSKIYILFALIGLFFSQGCMSVAEPALSAKSSERRVVNAVNEEVSAENVSTNSLLPPKKSRSLSEDKATMPKFNVWRPIGSIIFLMAGLLILNSLLKKIKFRSMTKSSNKHINVIERMAIDHRKSLLLVDVDGKRLLVGTGADGVDSIVALDGSAKSVEQSKGLSEKDEVSAVALSGPDGPEEGM